MPDARRIEPVDLEEEMKSSYLDYAMSVIVGRALPYVQDGLKPVHRRILWCANEEGVRAGDTRRKSAYIVGSVKVVVSRLRTALPIASFSLFKGSSWSWACRALSSCAQLLRRRR